MHAVLGTSDACIATHASDMAVALAALDATVVVHARRRRSATRRSMSSTGCPERRPNARPSLERGDVIVARRTHARAAATAIRTYLKLRDRASYEFALVSVGARRSRSADDGTIARSRLALGGVGNGAVARARCRTRARRRRSATPELLPARGRRAAMTGAVTTRAQRLQGRTRETRDRPRAAARSRRAHHDDDCSNAPRAHAGSPIDRIDGPLKVTGAARYAADAPVEHPLFAVLVQSTISRGRIRAIDETRRARRRRRRRGAHASQRAARHADRLRLHQPRRSPSRTCMPLQTRRGAATGASTSPPSSRRRSKPRNRGRRAAAHQLRRAAAAHRDRRAKRAHARSRSRRSSARR